MTMTEPVRARAPQDRTRRWHGSDTSWMRLGACDGQTVEIRRAFFADDRAGANQSSATRRAAQLEVLTAKSLCWKCDVRDVCLDYAVTNRMQGVWGATTEKERRTLRARKAKT